MAVVLQLTDGTTTIDFTTGDFVFRRDGLQIGLPDIHRPSSGLSLLYEGERIADRQFGNREIGITFKLKGSTHDALVENVRKLTRMLEIAHATTRDGFGKKIILKYKLDNASQTVVFDVLDGEFDPGEFAAVLVRRNALFIDARLKLICEPFARSESPCRLSNYLSNPFFCRGYQVGHDAGHMIDFVPASSQYMSNVAYIDVPTASPFTISMGGWFYRDAQSGALEYLVENGTTTVQFRLTLTATNKLEFSWWDSTNAIHTVTGATSPSAAEWHFVGVTVFSPDGIWTITVLTLDGQVDATLVNGAVYTGRTPAGGVNFCASNTPANFFDGKLSGWFVIGQTPILPYQLYYLYRYGIMGLASASPGLWGGEASINETPVLPRNYFGLSTDVSGIELHGLWPFHETSGAVLDISGVGKNLTLNGSPTRTKDRRNPDGWTAGSALTGTTDEGIYAVPTPFGPWCFRFNGSMDANRYLASAIGATGDTTIIIVANNVSGSSQTLDVGVGATNFTISAPVGRSYWILTRTSGTLKIGRYVTAGSINLFVEAVMVASGKPFGTYASFTDVTSNPPPLIGSRKVKSWPDNRLSMDCTVPVFGIPGDVPATCKVILQNAQTNIRSPIRIGCQIGGNPHKQIYTIRASLLIPTTANGVAYSSGANPTLVTGADTIIKDRMSVSLPSLFPHPDNQQGQFKLYLGVEGRVDVVYPARMQSLDQIMTLSGDPAKEVNSTSAIHMLDCGVLSWPPDSLLSSIRNGDYTGRPRTDNQIPSPLLSIASLADAINVNIDMGYLFLVPINGGFFTLAAPAVSGTNPSGGLRPNEILVIDTTDEQLSPGYIMAAIKAPAESVVQEVPSLASGDLSMTGTGFYLPPATDINFVVNQNLWAFASSDLLYGQFQEAPELLFDLEYTPRFLYV